MEAAVDAALKEFSGDLVGKLRAVVEEQLVVRIAALNRRERELDVHRQELSLHDEALKEREANLERREAALQQESARAAIDGAAVLPAHPPVQSPMQQVAQQPAPARTGLKAGNLRYLADPTNMPMPARSTTTPTTFQQPPFPATERAGSPESPRTRPVANAATSALFRPPAPVESPRVQAIPESPGTAQGSQPAQQGSAGPLSARRSWVVRSSSCGPLANPAKALGSMLETTSAGPASELKDMFEKKAIVARQEASPHRRRSWRQVELALPDGSQTERFRAHEAPYRRVSGGPVPLAVPPPQKRSLEELLKADQQRQRAD